MFYKSIMILSKNILAPLSKPFRKNSLNKTDKPNQIWSLKTNYSNETRGFGLFKKKGRYSSKDEADEGLQDILCYGN